MRFFLAMLLALLGSTFAGTLVGVLATEWVRGDDSYILVLFAVPAVALIALVPFMISGVRPDPSRAANTVALFLSVLLGLTLCGFALLEFGASGTIASAWPGIQVMLAVAGACATAVLFQWVFFRVRAARPARPAPPRFGRQPEVRDA